AGVGHVAFSGRDPARGARRQIRPCGRADCRLAGLAVVRGRVRTGRLESSSDVAAGLAAATLANQPRAALRVLEALRLREWTAGLTGLAVGILNCGEILNCARPGNAGEDEHDEGGEERGGGSLRETLEQPCHMRLSFRWALPETPAHHVP